jgi:methionine-gamma-lyase
MSETTRKATGFATKLIHAGDPPEGPGAPIVEPLVLATTFEFETAAEFGRVMAEEEYGFLYGSLRNPTVEQLAGACAEIEGGEAAQIFSSGMAAIAAALFTNLEAGDTLLAPVQLYGNTYALLERHLSRVGVEIVYLDATDPAAWERPARVRYVETLANPGFPLADLEAIAATKGDGLLVVDNTFASPALCRPLERGADLVCESATKFLNGHHDVMAGVLAGRGELVEAARQHRYVTGGTLDPFAAFLLRRGLKTLALRMERASLNALRLARFLRDHEAVESVRYIGLDTDPQHDLALRQLDDSGAMLAFTVRGGRAQAERVMDGLELCARATSLGGLETVVSHPASTSHRQFSPEQLEAAGISQGTLRVAVGCEDGDDLVADLARSLSLV